VLLAISPNAIEHCRRLWGHDTIVFWSALSLYGTVRGIQRGRKRWLWLAMACAAAAQSCHLSGVFLWVFPLGALWRFRPAHTRSTLLFGAGSLAFLYAPWLLAEVKENDLEGIRQILRVATGTTGGEVPQFPVPAIVSWLTILVDSFHNDLFGPEYGEFLFERRWFALAFLVAQGLGTALVVAGQACLVHAARHEGVDEEAGARRHWALLVLLAGAGPAVAFTVLPVTAVPPYQLPAMVPLVLGAALLLSRSGSFLPGLRRVARHLSGDGRLTVGLLVAVLLAMGSFGVLYTLRARAFVAAATPHHRVSTVLRFKLDAMSHILGTRAEAPFSIIQDGRRESAGVDFWVLYLHYWVGRDPNTPVNPAAPVVYVLVDSKTILVAEVSYWLSGRPYRSFGNLLVFRFSGAEAREWRRLTTQFPTSRPNPQS
jgi:hypothetical protein